MRKTHTFMPRTTAAAEILGAAIASARRERRVSQGELAERAGISQGTVHNVEQGSPTVAVGIVFELAALVGLDLLADPDELPRMHAQVNDRLRLLPSRVRARSAV